MFMRLTLVVSHTKKSNGNIYIMAKKAGKKTQSNRSNKTRRNVRNRKNTKKQKRRTNKQNRKKRATRKRHGVKRGGCCRGTISPSRASSGMH